MADGKRNWYVVDGWTPSKHEVKDAGLVGHECLMILNCQDTNANVLIDIYFETQEPIEGIPICVDSKRIKCLRLDIPEDIGGTVIKREFQYSIRVRSDVDVVVQYGRMDVTQPNLSFLATMGYAE